MPEHPVSAQLITVCGRGKMESEKQFSFIHYDVCLLGSHNDHGDETNITGIINPSNQKFT